MKKSEWLFRTVLPALLCILCLGILGNGLRSYKRRNNEETLRLTETRAELSDLDAQKKSLEKQIKDLQDRYKAEHKPYYIISPVYAEPDDTVFPQIADMLSKYRWSGMIGLSPDFLPGDRGMLSMDEFEEMIESGWEACLYWEGKEPLRDFLTEMEAELDKKEIDFPDTLIMVDKSYPADYETIAMEYDLTNVVYYSTAAAAKIMPVTNDNGIREILLCDWYERIFDTYLTTARENGGIFCTTCTNYYEDTKLSLKDTEKFFDYLYSLSEKDEKCIVGPITEMLELKEEEEPASDRLKYENELKVLTDELEQIEQRRRRLIGIEDTEVTEEQQNEQ